MPCDCDKYIDCNSPKIQTSSISDSAGYTHSVRNKVEVTNLPNITFLENTERDFSVNYGWDRNVDVTHYIRCADSKLDEGPMSCGTTKGAKPSSSCQEHCVREINVPYYLDRQRDIFVYKNIKETLDFNVSSTKTAKFLLNFGVGYFHKICILNDTKTKGTEKFIMVKDGVATTLAEQTYQYNPFPATEGGGATWGLYGNTIQRFAVADTPNVACILLFPLVPKRAIPQDNDVIAYGFYDYNAIDGGFVENSLSADDGGKDYFYPYWCRQMPLDSLWRATADNRYSVIYSAGKMDLSGTLPWSPAIPVVNEFPFGSFTKGSEDTFITSCILQFGQHADSTGVVYNKASFGDLFKALTANKLTLGKFTKFDPMMPI